MNHLITQALESPVDTIPVVLSHTASNLLFLTTGMLGLIIFCCVFSAIFLKRISVLGGAIFFAVPAVITLVLGVLAEGTADEGQTVRNVQSQYGITINNMGTANLSLGEDQKTTPIQGIVTVDGDEFAKGALVSRDGEVAVYVYEEGSTDPVALEFFSADEVFPAGEAVDTVPTEMRTSGALGAWLSTAIFLSSLVFLMSMYRGKERDSNSPEEKLGAWTFVFVALAFLIFSLVTGAPKNASTWKTMEAVEASYGMSFTWQGVDLNHDPTEKTRLGFLADLNFSDGRSYERGFLVSRDGEVAVYVFEDGSDKATALAFAGDEDIFPHP